MEGGGKGVMAAFVIQKLRLLTPIFLEPSHHGNHANFPYLWLSPQGLSLVTGAVAMAQARKVRGKVSSVVTEKLAAIKKKTFPPEMT